MNPSLVLFDFDGTLADSFEATFTICNRLAPSYGFKPIALAAALDLRNKGAHDLIRESGIPIRKLPGMVRTLKRELQLRIPTLEPHPGLHDALASLRAQGRRLGIVTSNSAENVATFLENHGWRDWFETIETGSTLFGKGRLIRRVLKRARLAPADACYVGDEQRDIEAARDAGIPAIAVTWGFNDRELLARHSPDHLIDTPDELKKIMNDEL